MHAWKIILGALHPLPRPRSNEILRSTPSPLVYARPSKGFAQLFHAVLGTIRSVADVVDHDRGHDYDGDAMERARRRGKGRADWAGGGWWARDRYAPQQQRRRERM